MVDRGGLMSWFVVVRFRPFLRLVTRQNSLKHCSGYNRRKIFCHGSSCSIVVVHVMVHVSGLNVMVRGGSWWFVVVRSGSVSGLMSWFVVVQYLPANLKIGVVFLKSQLQLMWWFVVVRGGLILLVVRGGSW